MTVDKMMIDKKLERMLRRVEKPARYIGGEVNIIRKDPETVGCRLAFAFPDTYEIGMSYMGLQILYNILNQNEKIACERVFAPAPDMEELLRKEHMPLFTLENFTPVSEMDLLGFTLQYEMSYTNVLNMMELSCLPIHSRVRMEEDPDAERYPVVIAGGPCAFNPEPLADFIDAFLIGDGEELLEQVALAWADVKEEYAKVGHAGGDHTGSERTEDGRADGGCTEDGHTGDGRKLAFLKRIARMDGVYVPLFYEPEYCEDGTISRMNVLEPAAPEKVRRAILADIDPAAFPTRNLVPLIETVHDRSVVETFRGCTRGCRFCQAGMIYRPVRERKPQTILKLAMEQLANTGHDELSLLSLSTSDYSKFEDMAVELMGLCKQQNVALSLPSLRLDSFSFKVLDEIQGYRKSGLTFAPEAGSQRLRDVINKNITEEDIYGATRQAIELGWEHIKLYFMIGLPTETYEDLDGIVRIAKNIMDINFQIRGRKGGRFRVTVSVSNFVPKPHTPFQWEPQDTPQDFIDKHDYLAAKLRIKGVTFHYHESNTSALEAVFARGDRRTGKVLEEARKLGCRFDAWTEHFDEAKWEQAFENAGIDPDFYTVRKRPVEEVLPWDHIDSLVRRGFLEEERSKAIRQITTPDCRQGCGGCGINRYTECFTNV